jgi:hypothetical protein
MNGIDELTGFKDDSIEITHNVAPKSKKEQIHSFS